MNLNLGKKGEYYITSLDAASSQTWKDFLVQVGNAFKFPEYYGQNLNAFRDCINDLTWIEQENYMLIINNSDLLLNKGEQDDDIEYLKELFDQITENWKLGPDAPGDDETRKVSDFKVVYN